MVSIKRTEIALGIVMMGIGALFLFMTTFIPRSGVIDSAFVPYILAGGLCSLGLIQVFSARRIATRNEEHEKEASDDRETPETVAMDWRTVLKTVALILAYIAALSYVGFPLSTTLYLFAQFIVLTPTTRRKNYLIYGIIAAVFAAVIYLLFRNVFDIMLPSGFLG